MCLHHRATTVLVPAVCFIIATDLFAEAASRLAVQQYVRGLYLVLYPRSQVSHGALTALPARGRRVSLLPRSLRFGVPQLTQRRGSMHAPAIYLVTDYNVRIRPLIFANSTSPRMRNLLCIRFALTRILSASAAAQMMSSAESIRDQEPLPKRQKLSDATGEEDAARGAARAEDNGAGGNPAITLGDPVRKFMKEADVGITEYINSQPGFFAILKERL